MEVGTTHGTDPASHVDHPLMEGRRRLQHAQARTRRKICKCSASITVLDAWARQCMLLSCHAGRASQLLSWTRFICPWPVDWSVDRWGVRRPSSIARAWPVTVGIEGERERGEEGGQRNKPWIVGADCRGSCWGLDRPGGGDAATGVDKIAHHDQTGSLQVFSREGRAATFHSFVFIFMMKGITEKGTYKLISEFSSQLPN